MGRAAEGTARPGAAVPAAGRAHDPVPRVLLREHDRVLGGLGHELEELFLAIVLGLVVFAVYKLVRPDALPRMDWRAGAWVLPWLGALAVISYLGSYGDQAAHDLGLGVGALATLGVSVVVYLAAYGLRLRGHRVREMLGGGSFACRCASAMS